MALGAKRGRRSRFHHYEEFEAGLPLMKKRPKYLGGIGLFRGDRGTSVWLKVTLRNGGLYKGRTHAPGEAVEIKLGARGSWTWEQMETRYADLQGRADRGEPLEDVQGVLFSDHAKDWLTRKKATARGWGVMNGHVSKHLNPTFGAKALTDITLGDVNRWSAVQLASLKPGSVQREVNTLKAILNDAVKMGLLERSPAERAEAIRGIAVRQRWLKPDELKEVFEAADRLEAESKAREKYKDHEITGWLRDFAQWAVLSGMRRQEILNLKLGDFEAVNEELTIVHILQSKSGKPRAIATNKEMLAIRDRLATLPRDVGDDRLFPVSLSTAKRRLTKLWQTCGLDNVRLHDLRRTHANHLVTSGVDLRTVAGRLGHADLGMLEKHYAVFRGDLEAANKAQEMFEKTA
jgi:integrase